VRRLPVLLVLGLSACNLVFGLQEASERSATDGGGAGGAGGAETSTTGSTTTGPDGAGGAGGSACPPEEAAGPGIELLANGSFERGAFGWLTSGLRAFDVQSTERFCGCQSGAIVLGPGYAELRAVLPAPMAGTYHARARLKAADLVDAVLLVRIDNVELAPPLPFGLDAADEEGADGWRTAEGSWPISGGNDALLALAFDGTSAPPDTEVLVDCVSLTYEP
jgi:hypothetical protein